MLALVQHHLAVHEHGVDSHRILKRILERRLVGDGRGIEDHQVGPLAFLDRAAIGEAEDAGRQRRHLADRFFERNHLQLAHVAAEHAREGAEVARMRHAGAQRSVDGQ